MFNIKMLEAFFYAHFGRLHFYAAWRLNTFKILCFNQCVCVCAMGFFPLSSLKYCVGVLVEQIVRQMLTHNDRSIHFTHEHATSQSFFFRDKLANFLFVGKMFIYMLLLFFFLLFIDKIWRETNSNSCLNELLYSC